MKKLITIFGLALLMSGPAFSEDLLGLWKTIPDDNGVYGHIQITDCNGKLCGELIASFNASDNSPYESDNVGKLLVWDMVNEGNGHYGSGKVWSPDRDKIYNGKLILDGDELTVQGCVFIICRDGGTWSRVN